MQLRLKIVFSFYDIFYKKIGHEEAVNYVLYSKINEMRLFEAL